MRLLQIEYFLTIADTRSITEAARRLYISQPALSKQIKLLEEELGTALMHRLPRGIVLTDAGKQFADDCSKIMQDLQDAVRKVSDKSRIRTLRINCFDGAVIEDFMPALYNHIHSFDPDLQIKLMRHSMKENREALRSDNADILIEIQFPDSKKNDNEDIFNSKLLIHRKGALIYSVNSPLAKKEHVSLEDFEHETLFSANKKDDLHLAEHALLNLKANGINNPKTEIVDNLMSIMSNIKLGLGYSLLAESSSLYNSGLISFPLPADSGIDVVAIWKKSNTFVSGLMETFEL